MIDDSIPDLPDELDFERGRVTARFGIVAAAGYQPLPDVLLFHQADLGITSEELNVALHILAHWYAPDRLPFLSAKTIARRMGCSERTIERYLTGLRRKGFLRKDHVPKGGRKQRKGHDLNPLIESLKPYAQERLVARQKRLREQNKAVT